MNRVQIKINTAIKKKIAQIKKYQDLISDHEKEVAQLELEFHKADSSYKVYTEVVGRGKSKREVNIGKIHWNECFVDEDTGDKVYIERSRIITVDGAAY